ncbi:MAG: ATP-binding protein [Kiritimatiellae bacterium]|nr:ATP-binding protein [Kiritimatiellia bacterium]
MMDFEKLGSFFLGSVCDAATAKAGDELLLYDSKDLTTHAVAVGMTGSGKTGLAMAMLEEAAIDGIPSIVIDPKGDMGNLCLRFPDLRAGDFLPWIDESEAARKGVSAEAFASAAAEMWRKGLEQSGQGLERVRKLQEAAEVAVYTPGNSAGRPLRILRSFDAPPAAVSQDSAALRERVQTAVSGLLALLGLEADPVQSRDHILLSSILDGAWREGRSLDLAGLIHAVQKPPFSRVGVFDLESFYPAQERMRLAMSLNNLLAAPGFADWMAGEPLDIQRLLYTPAGKPKMSVLYLAHLPDAERMFFVTVLFNEIISWMRAQSGTGSLRALLYMDEIFGYFPPTANPPSKTPMLTLLKQARAFGLGVVLSTQNPVDLDYKGLANCGTWFIGRLQTEQDRQRVIDGLAGAASATGGGFDRAETGRLLSGLGNRVFLMRNAHENEPVLFRTRWALSYLRGPLTLPQIKLLAAPVAPAGAVQAAAPAAAPAVKAAAPAVGAESFAAPVRRERAALPQVTEFFMRPARTGGRILYRPRLVGFCKLHVVDSKHRVDTWLDRTLIAPFADDEGLVDWDEADTLDAAAEAFDRQPLPDAAFAQLPARALSAGSYAAWGKELAAALYRTFTLDLYAAPELKLISRLDEDEEAFRARAAQLLRERRDKDMAKLKTRYAPKVQTLTDQIRRAEERMNRERAQAGHQKMSTAISIGATLLGAFLGRGARSVGTVGRAATAMKSASRIGKESGDVARAAAGLEALRARLSDLEAEFESAVTAMDGPATPERVVIERRPLRPRKSDLSVGTLGLCWTPWRRAADGVLEPA